MTTSTVQVPLSSRLFTVHGNKLVAEISELPGNCFLPLKEATNSVGFSIKSHKTERVVVFKLIKKVVNSDNEITSWVFRPVLDDVPVAVEIFND